MHFAILGEGLTSRYASRAKTDATQLAKLHREVYAAAAKVGVRNILLQSLPDNRLDTMPLLDVVKIVEEMVDRLRPEVIYTHHGGDPNVDQESFIARF